MHRLIHGNCLDVIPKLYDAIQDFPKVQCVFADPPDNIGLGYSEYKDKRSKAEYVTFLDDVLSFCWALSPIVWFSFNSRWTAEVGEIACRMVAASDTLEVMPCVQTFTFGQHNHHDLGNNHRPLWRFMARGTPLYPDTIRVPSWRQEHGDKRADPRGRVPGDVFDFPRVTGNSKQRRRWHPTQLHEGLVERCVKMSTLEGQHVVDPFGGTGTTLRVCNRLNRPCTLIEMDANYCREIASENSLEITKFQP